MRQRIEEMLKEAEEFMASVTDNTPPKLIEATKQNIYLLTSLLHSEDGEVSETELRQIFRNHSDCYTTFEIPSQDGITSGDIGSCQALTEDGFIRVMKMMPNVIASQHSPIVKDGWISIKDKLPEDGQRCLVMHKNRIEILTHDGYSGCWDDAYGDDHYCEYNVTTHWMPLPPAPSKGDVK